jgi:hypothetical protein
MCPRSIPISRSFSWYTVLVLGRPWPRFSVREENTLSPVMTIFFLLLFFIQSFSLYITFRDGFWLDFFFFFFSFY